MVGIVSRFSKDPHESHYKVAKRILRYIQGISHFRIHYTSRASQIVGFSNSNWLGDVDYQMSTSHFVFYLGSSPIALSSIEVDYQGADLARQVILWLRQLMTRFGFPLNYPTSLWYDNHSIIHISHNPMEHQHTRHIEIHMHFIKQLIQNGVLSMEYLSMEQHVADIFTKPLALPRYLWS